MKKSLPEPEIIKYLDNLKLKLKSNNTYLHVAYNRDKNFVFAYLYNITKDVIKDVLLDLKPSDFKFVEENTNPNFPANLLYVFGPVLKLNDALGVEREIEMYIKIDLCEGFCRINVISFHEAEHEYEEI